MTTTDLTRTSSMAYTLALAALAVFLINGSEIARAVFLIGLFYGIICSFRLGFWRANGRRKDKLAARGQAPRAL